MASRWSREFTCDWCGELSRKLGGELRTPGRLGWAVQWRLCPVCVDQLYYIRGHITWSLLQALVAAAKQLR